MKTLIFLALISLAFATESEPKSENDSEKAELDDDIPDDISDLMDDKILKQEDSEILKRFTQLGTTRPYTPRRRPFTATAVPFRPHTPSPRDVLSHIIKIIRAFVKQIKIQLNKHQRISNVVYAFLREVLAAEARLAIRVAHILVLPPRQRGK